MKDFSRSMAPSVSRYVNHLVEGSQASDTTIHLQAKRFFQNAVW